MAFAVNTASALQAGDRALVIRGDETPVPANVILKDGAAKAVGTAADDLAAGNRGIKPGGTVGQVPVKTGEGDYEFDWGDSPGGIADVSGDTTPQLGGDLDLNGFDIIGMVIGADIQPFTPIADTMAAIVAEEPADKLDFASGLVAEIAADPGLVGIDDDGKLVRHEHIAPGGALDRVVAIDGAGNAWLPTYPEVAEILAGTTDLGLVIVELRLAGDTEDLTTGDGKDIWIVPAEMDGWTIESVSGHVITAGTTGASTFMVANVTDAVDVLSAALSVASGGTDATGGTVNASNNTLTALDRIRGDVDSVSTTKPKGGRIYLKCRAPAAA